MSSDLGIDNQYGSGMYGFPRHDVSPETKLKKDWNAQYCMAIYNLYKRNLTGITYSDVDLFARWRSYGAGEQDKAQYMDLLGIGKKPVAPTIPAAATTTAQPVINQPNDWTRKGYMNINWEILPIAPNFKSVVLGMFEDMDYNVYADAIDEASSAQRQEMKWSLYVQMMLQEYLAGIEQVSGVQLQKPEYMPKSAQELEMFSNLGGFKLKSEIAMEQAIDYTLYTLSEWKELRHKLFEDAFELGVLGCRDYIDPITKKAKIRYCDPAMSVIPYTRQTEFTDMPFAGEFIFYTIAELRSLTKADGTPEFTEEELKDIAKKCYNQFNNPTIVNNWNVDVYGRYEYDTFRCMVLDCEYKSDDYVYTTKRTTADGREIAHTEKYGNVKKNDKKKTQVTKTLMVYKCKWIVGTNYCWDYGHQFDIPRPTPSQANLSFHFYRIKGGSTVKRMIPSLDSIQLSWLKLQNEKAKAAPSGLAIEYGSLVNISIGNQKLQPLDVLKIRNQDGTLLYQATTHRTYMPGQTNYKPIQELKGGIGEGGLTWLTLISQDIDMIRQITGINSVADSSSPAPGQLVGVSEISMQAASNALKPLFSGYITVKERACKNVTLRIQLMVKFNEVYELGYSQALGSPFTQALKIGSEVNNAMFGIRIEARPSEQEKQTILMAAQESMKAGKNGYIGISMSDYLQITTFVRLGMLKFAQAYLAAKERELEERKMREQQQAIEAQGQQNMQLEQMKGKVLQDAATIELEKIKAQGEQTRLNEQEKRETIKLQHQLAMEKLDKEKNLDMRNDIALAKIENKNNLENKDKKD